MLSFDLAPLAIYKGSAKTRNGMEPIGARVKYKTCFERLHIVYVLEVIGF